MSNAQSTKGNPAHVRMGNKRRKDARAMRIAKQEERKRANDSANRARAAANNAARKLNNDFLSRWDRACLRRANSPARVKARQKWNAVNGESN